MKILLSLLFISNIAYSQFSCLETENAYRMDTLIHKDEYYELVYQLNQYREKNDSLETKNQILEWETKSYEKLLSLYKEELLFLESNARNRKRRIK
jgi:hypothetical protein